MIAPLNGCLLQVDGSTSDMGLFGVLDCSLFCNSLRREVPALTYLPSEELGARPRTAMSTASGLVRFNSRSLKNGVGSGGVHVSRSLLWSHWIGIKATSHPGCLPLPSSIPALIDQSDIPSATSIFAPCSFQSLLQLLHLLNF